MQNNTDALKRAIIEGMNAMLAAIDNVGTATPQSKPKEPLIKSYFRKSLQFLFCK